MQLHEAIAAHGMIPPKKFAEGRWLRFPGVGKGHSNRAGWCRIITPTLAIFGDWSSDLRVVWTDETHRDTKETQRLLEEARRREREFARAQQATQRKAEDAARKMLTEAVQAYHPYLARKGFPATLALTHGELLLVPVRAAEDYRRLISLQTIAPDGTKLFLKGARTMDGVYRLGTGVCRRTVLCEGYATGLTLHEALGKLPGTHQVIVCFSARNLVAVAPQYPHALVCADNDKPDAHQRRAGQEAAEKTGMPWIMPPQIGTDFNDFHQQEGIWSVIGMLREAPW